MTPREFDPLLSRRSTAAPEGEEGQGLAEYGLILALIAVVCVAAVTALGGTISGLLTSLAGNL
jgi:pilus assembly protein Flp/PilA